MEEELERTKLYERVVCADGFSMSVQAHRGAYCSPRDGRGPFWTVEVGFPSAHEPLLGPTVEPDPVWGYVRVETIRAIIAAHGGQVGGELPPLLE